MPSFVAGLFCRCGRMHGKRYHDYLPGIAPHGVVSLQPVGAVSFDPTVYEKWPVKTDLSKAPHLCSTCRKLDEEDDRGRRVP